ncbi:inositol monophosphatase family protein [Corynebacterium uterequi]|uniref:Inositol-1-monophosphatase n=1 Tax=Corynebacterium uterequi TaxID=1072256 RepID=A0A0G3HH60_9CORY|nr:inositol monophosphatase family protein [Corynebacterium uterequi]AKK11263.1 inositol monophosphatase/fructose-1,6-bisphosphatase family protein [Corynebacterium uterequi]
MDKNNFVSVDPQQLRDLARGWAREAAGLIQSRRAELSDGGDIRDHTKTKSTQVDPVTIVDMAAEEFIVGAIRSMRPDDGIIGEEGTNRASTSGVSWVIDPIDGTVNFIYGIPQYAVSVAAAVDGHVVAGAVINVVSGDLYSAAAGAGATVERSGKTIELKANPVEDLRLALVSTGFAYTPTRRAHQGAIVAQLLGTVRDIRRMGAAALDLCAVAEGRVDAYYEHGINSWDYAAGSLIASEAGAVVVTPPLTALGAEGNRTLACAPGIATEFLTLLEELGGAGTLPA